MLWVYLLFIGAAVSTAGGLAGLISGWRATQSSGPDTLMHYPPPLVWMRSRLLSARWVMRVGAMYVLAGFTMGAIGLQATSIPRHADMNRACESLIATLTNADWTPGRWTQRSLPNHQPGCSAQLLDTDGVRWFTIRSFPQNGMLGEQFREQTIALERNAMALKPVRGIGERAMMATPRSKVLSNPTLVIATADGTHTVEMNAQLVAPAAVIEALRTLEADSM